MGGGSIRWVHFQNLAKIGYRRLLVFSNVIVMLRYSKIGVDDLGLPTRGVGLSGRIRRRIIGPRHLGELDVGLQCKTLRAKGIILRGLGPGAPEITKDRAGILRLINTTEDAVSRLIVPRGIVGKTPVVQVALGWRLDKGISYPQPIRI